MLISVIVLCCIFQLSYVGDAYWNAWLQKHGKWIDHKKQVFWLCVGVVVLTWAFTRDFDYIVGGIVWYFKDRGLFFNLEYNYFRGLPLDYLGGKQDPEFASEEDKRLLRYAKYQYYIQGAVILLGTAAAYLIIKYKLATWLVEHIWWIMQWVRNFFILLFQ